jgi:UDPglucose 6-dehydrogenase
MRVSVIGLGKLGSPLAAVLASKGHDVIGLDISEEFVRLINAGKAPVEEPQLQELMDGSRARLRATTSYDELVENSDISFVIVPTPSDKSGIFTNKFILACMNELGQALRKKSSYHVINITSTVMPGSTGGIIRETIEAASGKTVGREIGLCYNPEFIALGSVVRNMLYPDMLLIGESDPRAGDMLESVYKQSCSNDPPVQRMNFVNAELTKISVNTYVTTKISYANMLADICDHLPGADVDVVTTAIGKDSRIGSKYLQGALGYGGPCFPRDNVAFSVLARGLGAHPDIAEATDRLNDYQIDRLIALVKTVAEKGASVTVLGMSYKPDTPVIEESQGVELARRLADESYMVTVYDPMALANAMSALGDRVNAAPNVASAVASADVVVITTPWAQFKDLLPGGLKKGARRVAIIDCWRILSAEKFAATTELIYLGYGRSAP